MALSSVSVSARGTDGIPYRVDINGGGTTVDAAGQWLHLDGGDRNDRGLDPIWPKELRLFMQDVDLTPLFDQPERSVPVSVYDTRGGSDFEVFRGFMVTDFMSDAPLDPVNELEVRAIDGLGLLDAESLDSLFNPGEVVPEAEGIARILGTLHTSGIQIELGVHWYPNYDAFDASLCPNLWTDFAVNNYREDRPKGTFWNLKKVLVDLCYSNGLTVQQVPRDGVGLVWHVRQRDAIFTGSGAGGDGSSPGAVTVWTFLWDGTLIEGAKDVSIGRTLDPDTQDIFRDHGREFKRREQQFSVTYDHLPIDSLIREGGFEKWRDTSYTFADSAWSRDQSGSGDVFVTEHEGEGNTPGGTQENKQVARIEGLTPSDNRDFISWRLMQTGGDIQGIPPNSALRVGQTFYNPFEIAQGPGNITEGLVFKVKVGDYFLTDFTREVKKDALPGSGVLRLTDGIERPLPQGARLPVQKPNDYNQNDIGDQINPDAYITLSERHEEGAQVLRGDLSAEAKSGRIVRYAGFVSGSSILNIKMWRNGLSYGRFEVLASLIGPNGNQLEGPLRYEVGSRAMWDAQRGRVGYVDDVALSLERGGSKLSQTTQIATVDTYGKDESVEHRVGSGPSDRNLARLRGRDPEFGTSFLPLEWGVGPNNDSSLTRSQLNARQRLRYWRGANTEFRVTAVTLDQMPPLFGDELVEFDGSYYTVHSLQYVPQEGGVEVRLVEWKDRGTDGLTIRTTRKSGGNDGSGGGGTSPAPGPGGGGVANTEIASFRPGNLSQGSLLLSHYARHEWSVASVLFVAGTPPASDFDLEVSVAGTTVTVTLPSGQAQVQGSINETLAAGTELRVTAQSDDLDVADMRTSFDVL